MSDASSDVPDVVESVNVMEWNVTLAPSMVNTSLLSLTLFTLFDTESSDDDWMAYAVLVEVKDVADTSSL